MFLINGTGIDFRGETKHAEDGTYQATRWITFLWFPIFPLGTYMVRNGKSINWIISHYQEFSMCKVKTDWRHVKRMYAKYYGVLLLIFIILYCVAKFRN